MASEQGIFNPANHPLTWFTPGYLSRQYGTPLEQVDFTAIDFETTGLEPEDRIVEVAAVRFRVDGTTVDEFATRVNPVTRKASETTEYHGLEDDDVADAPTFAEIWPGLAWIMSGAIVVAHNLRFEDMFLGFETDRLGIQRPIGAPGVCSMVAAWSQFVKVSYSQKAAFRTLVGTWAADAHTALGDTRNLSVMLTALHRRLGGLRYTGPPPATFPGRGLPARVRPRAICEVATQWNSLPVCDWPVQQAAELDELILAVAEILTCMSSSAHRLISDIQRLMDQAGLPAQSFMDVIGEALRRALGEYIPMTDHVLNRIELLVAQMRSVRFAQKMADVVEAANRSVFIPPLLKGQRWQVTKTVPRRDEIAQLAHPLGVKVLVSASPPLNVIVSAQGRPPTSAGKHREVRRLPAPEAITFLHETTERAQAERDNWLSAWAQRMRNLVVADSPVPISGATGRPEWDEIMAFEPHPEELPPNWRWQASDYDGDDYWDEDDA